MFFLNRNLPTWERAARIIAGAAVGAAIASGFTTGVVTWLALATAATLVLTAFVGFCPACAMAGRRYLDSK
jgi:phosphate/sulfate permease